MIREGDLDYVLQLLHFDHRLTAEGMSQRCGELFTFGLDGYRWNYRISNAINVSEFRETLRDRFSLNAAGFMIRTDLLEVFPYAREWSGNKKSYCPRRCTAVYTTITPSYTWISKPDSMLCACSGIFALAPVRTL